MLDIKRLRLLVELSRRGTIAAVAQSLSYSPSAVSQQLGVLEKEAGVPLLEPMGRRVRLTTQGELLAAHAQTILTGLERAEAELAASRGRPVGTVRLAAFQSAILTLVPEALLGLDAEYPELRVEVTQLEPELSLPALEASDVDLVVAEEYPGHPSPHRPGVHREELLTDDLELVVPTGWGPVSLADLRGRPFAMEPPGTTAHEWAQTACRTAGFDPDVRYTSADLQVHLRMVEHGLAAGLLPRLAGAHRHPGVSAYALSGKPVRRVFTAVRTGARRHPAVTALAQALAASAGQASAP